jgi:hypothetical protein
VGGCSSGSSTSGTSEVDLSGTATDGTGGSAAAGGSGEGSGAVATGSPSSTGNGDGTAVGDDAGTTQGEAGVLTEGMWDDNLNYDFFTTYLSGKATLAGNPGFETSDYDAAHAQSATRSPKTVVDAVLVLDSTGSMGDEMAYLTAEFANIGTAISAAYPNADQRWALVLYRDRPDTDPGDEYIVKHYDFTSDLGSFSMTIAGQTAANGGDTPESPDLGLEELQKLSWREGDSVARVAFWVADAPDHVNEASALKQAILDTQTLGVHIYPVAASGTDDLLELSMRSAAQLTGGRYGFLTDDSGIGDPHKVPEIPCFFVTRLEQGLVRAIGMELSGTYIPPASDTILRTAGNPSAAGQCSITGGQTVTIF